METLKKYVPLNFELLANPINWVIVILMVLFAIVGLAFISQHAVIPEGKDNG